MQLSKGRAQPHHSPRPPPRATKGHRSSSRTLRVSLLLCAALTIGLILSTAGRQDPGQSTVQHPTGRKHKHDPMLPRHRSSRRRQKKQNDFHDRDRDGNGDGDGGRQAEVDVPAARHEHEDDRREAVNDEEMTPAPTAPALNHPLTFEEVLLAQKQTSAKPAEENGAAENQQGEAKPTDNAAGTDNADATDELQPRPKNTKAALGISWLTSVWRNIHDSLLTYHHGDDASPHRGDGDGGGDGETDQEGGEGGRRSIGGRRRSSRWSKLEEALHSVPLFPVIDDIVATTASASRSKSSIDHINKHERDVKDNPIQDSHLRESVSSFEDLPFPFNTRRFSGHDVRQTRAPLFEWRRRHSGLVFMTTVKPCTEGDELFRTHVAAISSWLAVSISKAPKDMGWGSNKKRRRRVFGPWPSKSPKKPKTRTTTNLNELNGNGRENERQVAEIEKKRASGVRSGSRRFQDQSIESAVPDFSRRRSEAAASSHAFFDHTGDMNDLLFPLSSAFSMFERVGRENRSFTTSFGAPSTSPSNLKANLQGTTLRVGGGQQVAKGTREDEDEDARLARALGRRWINEVNNARSPFYVTREDDADNAAEEEQTDRPLRHQRAGGNDEPDARENFNKGNRNRDVRGDLAGSSPLHEEGDEEGEEHDEDWDSEGYFEYVSDLSPVVVIADGESPPTEERHQRSQHDASVLQKRRSHHQAQQDPTKQMEQIPSLDENDRSSSILVNSTLQWLKRVTGTPLSEDYSGTLQQELYSEMNGATSRPAKSCAALLTKYFQRPDVLDAISTDAQRQRSNAKTQERSQKREDGRIETEDELTSGERALRPVLRPFVYHTADPTFQGKHGTVLLGPLFRHVVGSLFPSAATFCFINTDIILDPQSTSAVLEKTQRSFTDYFITGHRHTVDLRAPGLMRRAFPEAFATSASTSPLSASFSSSSSSTSSFDLNSARFSEAPQNADVENRMSAPPMRDSGSSVERVTKRVLQHFLRLKLVSTTEALHILHHLLPHHNNSEPHLGEETMSSSKNNEMLGNGNNTTDMTSSEEALDEMTAGTLSLEALDHRAFMELLLPKRLPGQHHGSHRGRHYHPHGHRVGDDTTTSRISSVTLTSVSFEFWRCVLRGEASYHRRRWRSHEPSADKTIPTGKISRFTRLSPQHIRHCLSVASLHKQHQSIVKKTSVVHAGGADPTPKSQTSSSNEFGRIDGNHHRNGERRSVDAGRANNAVSSVAASLEHIRIAGLRHTVWRWFNEPQEVDRLSPEAKSASEDNTVSSSRREKIDQAHGRPNPTSTPTSPSSLMNAMINGTLDRFFLSPQSLHRYKDRTDAEDYFFFSRSFFDLKAIPAFHIGRPAYDNWLVHHAIHRGCPAVDASGAIRAVHLKHGYGHLKAVREMAAKRRQLQQIDTQDREEFKDFEFHDSQVDDATAQLPAANRRTAARLHSAINSRRLQEATTPKPQSYWASAEQKENYRLGEQHGGWQHGLLDRLPWTWREVTSFSSFKRAIKTILVEKPGDISRVLFERLFGDLVFADVFEHLDASSGAGGSILVGSTPDMKTRMTVGRLDVSWTNETADLILKQSAFFGGENRIDENGGKVIASLRAMLQRELAAGMKAQLERRLTEEETERQQHFAENFSNKRPTTPRANVQTQQRSTIGTSSVTPPQPGSSLRVNRRKVDFTADTIGAVLSGLQKMSSSSSTAGSGLLAFAFDLRTGKSRGRSSNRDGDAQGMDENTRRGRQADLTPLGLDMDQETIVNQTLALFASPSLDHCYAHLAWLREKETKEQTERLKQFGNRPAGRNGKREGVADEHTEEGFIRFMTDLRSKSGAHTQRSSLIDQLWLGTESTREATVSLAPCALLSLRREVHLEVPEDKSWRSRGLAGPLGLGSRADHGRQCAASYGDEATRELLRRLLLVSW